MRQDRTVQTSIFDLFAKHEIGCELKKASAWLDGHAALIGLVAADLRGDGVQETGRHGLPAEAVLRCALLKQYRQLSYEELAFHLEDSASFRAFARLPWGWRRRPRLARSSPRGEEALAGHRVHPGSAEAGAALPRADQDRAHDPGLSARGRDAAGRVDGPGRADAY